MTRQKSVLNFLRLSRDGETARRTRVCAGAGMQAKNTQALRHLIPADNRGTAPHPPPEGLRPVAVVNGMITGERDGVATFLRRMTEGVTHPG